MDMLTNYALQDYSFSATEKNVDRGRSLIWSGEEPQIYFERLFLCVGVLSLWVAKQREPKGSPVLHRSSNLCFGCPPVSKLAGDSQSLMERIMRTKSTSTSATLKTRLRSKSLSISPKVIANIVHLSYERREASAKEKWHTALKVYIRSLNSREFDIAKHVLMFISQKPCLVDPEYSCEVIPFPLTEEHIAAEASK
jgi:hypothetical protein